ncbi:hypothetical protein MHYP_G00303500 [Metynnis hypsauchen]
MEARQAAQCPHWAETKLQSISDKQIAALGRCSTLSDIRPSHASRGAEELDPALPLGALSAPWGSMESPPPSEGSHCIWPAENRPHILPPSSSSVCPPSVE